MLKTMLLASIRTLWLVFTTWIRLIRDITSWHINMLWRIIMWTVSVTTLPFRALGALQREKMMQSLLQEMQIGLENLVWDNKKLRAQLQMIVKERHQMESILTELEGDHDKAIAKIELLEREVKHLKAENQRLKEVQSKGQWDPTIKTGPRHNKQTTSKSDEKENEQAKEIKQVPKRPSSKEKNQTSTPSKPTTVLNPLASPPSSISSLVGPDEAVNQQRRNALFQSIFSAMLSLLVGTVILQSRDPCVPLVMSLFTVVGLSMRSVVVFFSTIRNKPASDAVALLSINWFILGALAYPALPSIARAISPVVFDSLARMLRWLGSSFVYLRNRI